MLKISKTIKKITIKIKPPKEEIFSLGMLSKLHYKTPFFVFSKEKLLNNLKDYKKTLPEKTEICYSMKANSEKEVLSTLHKGGSSFEVASKYELALLKSLHVPKNRIIYGNSVKTDDQIRAFVKYGVTRFVFESEDELRRIRTYAPDAKVYVRVLVKDKANSVFKMSEKFGVSLKNAIPLLVKAKELDLVPYGISFNVGSQARNKYAWARGIKDVKKVIIALLQEGIKIQVINIGGGFPYKYEMNGNIPTLNQISKHINIAFKTMPYPIKCIAEPGRGLVADSYVLVTTVIGKQKRSNGHWLFLDTGTYNALLEAMAYQGRTKYKILPLKKYSSKKKEKFVLTGPTCDNLDVVNKEALLPSEIQVGDKLAIYATGAYTFTLMTPFNGFPKPKTIVL